MFPPCFCFLVPSQSVPSWLASRSLAAAPLRSAGLKAEEGGWSVGKTALKLGKLRCSFWRGTRCWLVLLPFSKKAIKIFAVLLLVACIAGSKGHLLGISTGRAGLSPVSPEAAVCQGFSMFTLQCWLFHGTNDGTLWKSLDACFILPF